LLRVRGYTFTDQGNSLTQQNLLTSQGRSIPPLLPFGYIMVIHSATPKFHNTYLSLRKEMDKESPIFLEKNNTFLDLPHPELLLNLMDIISSDQVVGLLF